MITLRRKGECECRQATKDRKHVCFSCSALSLKIFRIVLDLPDGAWYRVTRLDGDVGFRVEIQRQLEFAFSSPKGRL